MTDTRSPLAASPVPVEEFATGFQRTAVYRRGAGCVLIRTAGADRPTPLEPPPAHVRDALRALAARRGPAPAARIVLPDAVGDALHYELPGNAVAAKLSVPTPAGAIHITTEHAALALRAAGGALRRLHTELPAALVGAGPRGPARLAAWLRADPQHAGPRAAGPFQAFTRQRLGTTRLERVLDWCARLAAADDERDAFLHGAASLGAIVVAEHPPYGWLMAGEDLARGPAGHDMGWLLGEFVEWRMALGRPAPIGTAPMDPQIYEASRFAVLDGYGPLPDLVAAGRSATLRVFTHAHDYAAYMGWHPELAEYTATIADLIDDEGACAVTPQ